MSKFGAPKFPADSEVVTRGSFWNKIIETLCEYITVSPPLGIRRGNKSIQIYWGNPPETEIVKATSDTASANGLYPGKIMKDRGEGLVEVQNCWITTYGE